MFCFHVLSKIVKKKWRKTKLIFKELSYNSTHVKVHLHCIVIYISRMVHKIKTTVAIALMYYCIEMLAACQNENFTPLSFSWRFYLFILRNLWFFFQRTSMICYGIVNRTNQCIFSANDENNYKQLKINCFPVNRLSSFVVLLNKFIKVFSRSPEKPLLIYYFIDFIHEFWFSVVNFFIKVIFSQKSEVNIFDTQMVLPKVLLFLYLNTKIVTKILSW